MGAEAKLKELGITLPPPAKPLGNYIPGVRVGNLLFLSGPRPGTERQPDRARQARDGSSRSRTGTRSPARSASICSAPRATSSAASTR